MKPSDLTALQLADYLLDALGEWKLLPQAAGAEHRMRACLEQRLLRLGFPYISPVAGISETPRIDSEGDGSIQRSLEPVTATAGSEDRPGTSAGAAPLSLRGEA